MNDVSVDPRIDARQGWILVGGLFAVLTVSSGLGFYNLSLYMNVLADARGFALTDLSAATSVFFLAGGAAGLAVGQFLQRGDARLVIVTGAVLGGGAIALIGQVEQGWQLLALYALFGVGNTAVSLLPATTLVTRWFDARRRPLALSITSTGLSLGGVLLTPLSAALLERTDVAVALPILGLCYCLGIVPIAWLAVRSFPAGMAAGRGQHVAPGTAYRDALRSRFFIGLTIAYVLLMAGQVGGIAHLYNRGTEVAAPLDAAFAVSVLAALSVIGRLLGGWLLARVSIRGFTLLNVAGQGVGLGALAFVDSAHTLWLGAAVFGFTVGNLLMLQPLLLGRAFGLRDYARIFSTSQAMTTLGIAAGPLLIGLIHAVGGYEAAFGMFAVAAIVALATIIASGEIPEAPAG